MRPAALQDRRRALRGYVSESSVLSGRPTPLQNRVDPFGAICAVRERGEMYGNRGGRFHRDDRTLGSSRWKSKMWIICRLQFKGRRNDVFGKRYTDLFFADEPTALAAGHRPCFYCRRDAANAFIAALGDPALDRAPKLDARLDAERRTGHAKRLHVMNIDALPDGAMFAEGERAFAVKGDAVLEWSFGGYVGKRARPVGLEAQVLTPPTSLLALRNGYAPEWHSSAL